MIGAAETYSLTKEQLWNFVDTLSLQTEQLTLGGPNKDYSLGDLMFGYTSTLISDINKLVPTNIMWSDSVFKEGNAIRWIADVTPVMTGNSPNAELLSIEVLADSTNNSTGLVTAINGFNYLNL